VYVLLDRKLLIRQRDKALLCSEQSIAPLYIETLYSSGECCAAGFCMLMVVKSTNTDLPPIGFCNEPLLGGKYAGFALAFQ
jgi:hypothetical protein